MNETNQKFLELAKAAARSQKVLIGLSAALSFAAGSFAGYKRAIQQMEEHYALQADREIAEAKEHYRKLYKAEEYASPEEAAKALGLSEAAVAIQRYQGHRGEGDERPTEQKPVVFDYTKVVPPAKPDLTEVVRNVFTDTEIREIDLEQEMATRDPERPYLITQDEFGQNETEFTQATLTWYEGDEVMGNDRDEPVDFDVDEVVGLDNLKRFGEGSGDRNIVLVRNNELKMDYEIIRSSGKYSEEVAGFTDDDSPTEMKHSHRSGRFRDDDD
jgi:hypothetical protein